MSLDKEIREIKKELVEYKNRISKLESLFSAKPIHSNKKISIKEFMLSKSPIDDIQKTLSIGYYLEKYANYPSFNAKDLETGFGDAKESSPSNINDKVNQNISHGYMMKSREKKDKRKAWVLTNTGEKYVDAGFAKHK